MLLAKSDPFRLTRAIRASDSICLIRPTYWSLLVLVLAGCVTAGGLLGETPGERFRKAIAERERYCSTHQMAPGETTCDILKLKAPDPLATPEGRFAHSIKLPPPHGEPKEVYRAGMTSEEYFKALCDAEAGEFIFKTVGNVEGIFQMRPRVVASDDILQHLYAMEDPYGHDSGEIRAPEEYYVQPALGKYQFLEVRPLTKSIEKSKETYRIYYRNPNANHKKKYQTMIDGRGVFVPYIISEKPTSVLRSRYGYTWRGINRPYDRELGIAGGELILVDLQSSEVLAFRRGYRRTGFIRNNSTGVWWLTAQHCSDLTSKPAFRFMTQVLIPAQSSSEGDSHGAK